MRIVALVFCLVLFGFSLFSLAPIRITNFVHGESLIKDANEAIQKKELVGAALLMGSSRETVIRVTGKRSSHFETPIRTSDQWTLASNSKSILSLLLAEAVDKGLLKWSSSVREYWKTFPFDQVTVTDLLLHTSGIFDRPQVFQKESLMNEVKNLETISQVREAITLAILKENNLSDSSSQPFNYAHTNSLVAALVLEKVFRTPFEVLVENKIFKPLGLSTCGFGPSGSENVSKPLQPWGHLATETGWQTIPPTSVADFPEFMNPAARVHCSMSDFAKYLSEWNLVFRYESKRISRESQRALSEPHTASPYVRAGWIRMSNQAGHIHYAHTGNNFFESLQTVLYPKQDFFVSVSANSADIKTRQLLDSIIQKVEHRFGAN